MITLPLQTTLLFKPSSDAPAIVIVRTILLTFVIKACIAACTDERVDFRKAIGPERFNVWMVTQQNFQSTNPRQLRTFEKHTTVSVAEKNSEVFMHFARFIGSKNCSNVERSQSARYSTSSKDEMS
jgi:hypothetical protein